MEIATDDVLVSSTFGFILAVVTGAFLDETKRSDALAEECLATVVFVADDITKLVATRDDVADETLWAGVCLDIKQSDAVDDMAILSAEKLAEQLVEPADHEHRYASIGELTKLSTNRQEVGLDFVLAAVLATATDDDIGVFWKCVALVVADEFDVVAMPLDALHEDEHITRISIDVHVVGVELQNGEVSFGMVHAISSTVVSLASSRRRANIAV